MSLITRRGGRMWQTGAVAGCGKPALLAGLWQTGAVGRMWQSSNPDVDDPRHPRERNDL